MLSGYSDENKERYFQWFIGAVGSWELEKTGDTAEALDKAYITYSEFWSVLMAFGFMGFTRVRLRADALPLAHYRSYTALPPIPPPQMTGYDRKGIKKGGGILKGAAALGGFVYNIIEALQCDAAAKLAANPAHLARTVPLNTE